MKGLKNIKLPKVKRPLKLLLSVIVMFSLIGFVERNQQDKLCNNIAVTVDNQLDNYFINEQDIIALITDNGNKQIIGTPLYKLPLKKIEQEVMAHKYVENAEVYKDLKGNLVVKVDQNRPIARIVRPYAPDAYISHHGEILPVSDRYTARVVIVKGQLSDRFIEEGLTRQNRGRDFFELLLYLQEEPLWQAQIAELELDRLGNVTMYPQIGKQEIYFGKAENFAAKFKKLDIFFKKILPHKGWNHYQKVNVNFKNQIICE